MTISIFSRTYFTTAALSVFLLVTALAVPAYAQGDPQGVGGDPQPGASGSIKLNNPLGSSAAARSPQVLIGRVINFGMGIIGSLALLMFIYGGFIWMTAAGNDSKITQGRQILVWAVAGLAVVFFSYALVNFVIYQVILKTASGGSTSAATQQTAPSDSDWMLFD